MTWKTLCLLVFSLVVFAGDADPVLAQDTGADQRPPASVVMSLRRHLLHRFDENGNGRLDLREARQATKTVLGILRRNRGNPLVIAELPAGLRPVVSVCDRNRDGVLGPAEQVKLRRAMPHATRPPRQRPKPPVRPGDGAADGDDGEKSRHPQLTPALLLRLSGLLLQAFDRNKNEVLDPPERCHARRTLFGFLSRLRGQEIPIGSAPPRLGRILSAFDLNRDGKLGIVETQVLIRALKILLRPRPRPEPGEPGDGEPPRRPRPESSIGEDFDDLRLDGPSSDGGFAVRPGRSPRPDF